MPKMQPQIAVIGAELRKRPLTQHDAAKLGVTDLASRIRDLRRRGHDIATVWTVRPSRYRRKGQRVGLYVDLSRRYAKRAIREAAAAVRAASQVGAP